jgi:UDP-glucose 4-epimerase
MKRYRKAVVTGGAGFIGSHLCAGLLEDGLDTVALDNLSTGKAENVPSGVRLVVGDVLDETLVEEVFSDGVDIIFHEAAVVSVRESVRDFYHDAQANIMGTLNVLRAAINQRVKKLVYASSMAVYADNPARRPVPETFNTLPSSPYGLAKLTSENYLNLLRSTHDMDIISLRYFNTYGERQTFTPYVGVITIFVNRLLRGETPVIFGDGQQIRDFVYVKDVVKANLKAMHADIPNGVYNVGTGIGTSVNELASLLCNTINPGIRPVYTESRPEELRYSVADLSQITKDLGFLPEYTINESLQSVIDQYHGASM